MPWRSQNARTRSCRRYGWHSTCGAPRQQRENSISSSLCVRGPLPGPSRTRARLADGQRHARLGVEDELHLLRAEVGHADRAHQPLQHQLLHRAPRLHDARVQHWPTAPRDGPMNQVQVQVRQPQRGERLARGDLDARRRVVAVPQLACHEDALAHQRRRCKHGRQRRAHLALVLIDARAVDVPVAAGREGGLHRGLHLARPALPGACAAAAAAAAGERRAGRDGARAPRARPGRSAGCWRRC